MRSAQCRRELPAGAALSPTARAVPERCAGLVRRRTRPCESHTHESAQSDESDQPNKPDESDESDEPRDLNVASEPDDFGGSGQYPLRASYIGTG